MNDLLQTYHLLEEALLADPLLALASTVVWLDPLWMLVENDMDEEDDSLGMALSITRRAFPEIYAGAVQRLHIGANSRELEIYLCSEISQRGIPLDSLEFIAYGIPLTPVVSNSLTPTSTRPVLTCSLFSTSLVFTLKRAATASKCQSGLMPLGVFSPRV
jgi:hypothetical protein